MSTSTSTTTTTRPTISQTVLLPPTDTTADPELSREDFQRLLKSQMNEEEIDPEVWKEALRDIAEEQHAGLERGLGGDRDTSPASEDRLFAHADRNKDELIDEGGLAMRRVKLRSEDYGTSGGNVDLGQYAPTIDWHQFFRWWNSKATPGKDRTARTAQRKLGRANKRRNSSKVTNAKPGGGFFSRESIGDFCTEFPGQCFNIIAGTATTLNNIHNTANDAFFPEGVGIGQTIQSEEKAKAERAAKEERATEAAAKAQAKQQIQLKKQLRREQRTGFLGGLADAMGIGLSALVNAVSGSKQKQKNKTRKKKKGAAATEAAKSQEGISNVSRATTTSRDFPLLRPANIAGVKQKFRGDGRYKDADPSRGWEALARRNNGGGHRTRRRKKKRKRTRVKRRQGSRGYRAQIRRRKKNPRRTRGKRRQGERRRGGRTRQRKRKNNRKTKKK